MSSKQQEWINLYRKNIPVYEELTKTIKTLLTSIVVQENIECMLPIQARHKGILSFLEKIERKKIQRSTKTGNRSFCGETCLKVRK